MPFSQSPSPLFNIIAAKTYNAQWFNGSTDEAQITAAIAAAVADGALYVYVPANMLPYNASGVTFNSAIRMISESGNHSVYDARAYGAAGDGLTNDNAALNACASAAQAAKSIMYLQRGVYLFDSIPLTGILPLYLIGESQEGTTLKQNVVAQVAFPIAANANVEGTVLANFRLQGNSTALGGIKLGTAALYTAFTKLNNIRVDSYTGVGAYGIQLNSVQELDAFNCRFQDNYNGVDRPNVGFCTSTSFHGQGGFIGRSTNVGVNLTGLCSDITFSQQVLELSAKQAILASGVGSIINILDCYFEANNTSGTVGLAQIDLSGAAGAGNQVRTMLRRNHFHITTGSIGRHIRLDYTTRSVIADNEGLLSLATPVLVTANTQCHFQDNADIVGDVFTSIYSGLVGYGTSITVSDTDSTGRRVEMGNRRLENVHYISTQTTPPGLAINANAGTSAAIVFLDSATDLRGQIQLTLGSAAWATGVQATITFNRAFASAPKVLFSPANDPAAVSIGTNHCSFQATTTTFTINFGVAGASAANMVFNYWVVE